MVAQMAEKPRPYYLTVSEHYRLNMACVPLWKAFPETVGVFLVGSSLYRKDYRDVDVRMMLYKEDFRRLFPEAPKNPQGNYTWDLICVSISDLLARQTGLPIDFQIQEMDWANEKFPSSEHGRNAIGMDINLTTSKAQ